LKDHNGEAELSAAPADINVAGGRNDRGDPLRPTHSALMQSEARRAAVLEAVRDAVLTFNKDGRIIEANGSAARLFGLSREEILGRFIDKFVVDPKSLGRRPQAFRSPIAVSVDTLLGKRVQATANRADGGQFPAELSLTGVPLAAGHLFIATIRDLSEPAPAIVRDSAEENKCAARVRALHEIDRAMASTLDLASVLKVLLEKVEIFFPPAAASTVRLIDPRTQMLKAVACRNLDEEEWEAATFAASDLKRMLPLDTKVEAVVDAQGDSRALAPALLGKYGLVSLLRVPLVLRGTVVGVLTVFTKVRHEFSAEEIEFLTTLGGQAAIAISNSQLHAETEEHVARLRALREIDAAMASTLDLSNVLKVVLEKLEILLPIAAASTVRLLDPETGELQSLACRGLDEREWRSHGRVSPGGRAQLVIRSQAPLAVLNVQSDPHTYKRDLFRERALVSYLGAPLIAHGRALGVLAVYTREEHEFTAEETGLLTTLAGHAASAIHNSQLYERAEENVARLRALREIDAALTSTLELRAMLGFLLEKIDFFLPHHAATVRLHNNDNQLLELIASRNINEEEWKNHLAVARHARHSYAQTVFESRRPLVVPNIGSGKPPHEMGFLLRQGLVSFIGVPLIVKDKCLGLLTLYGRTEREFTAQETDFLSAIAGRAAIAIQNSQLYEESKNRAAELERSNRVKDEFLSVMSHELRTPLSVIIGYTGMLRDQLIGPLDEKQISLLDKIMLRGRDQLKIINAMMQAIQLQIHAMTVEWQTVQPVELLRALRSDYESLGKGVAIEWHYPDTLPPFATDETKLKQILQNLIDNALKFTERGKVEISARRSGGWIEFKVSDTGIGIAEQDAAQIFKKFHQVDGSETRVYGGIGLGLYIVESLVKLLGGSVGVESRLAKGSTFTVRLPYALPEQAALLKSA
jgi:PAS domain S-box-containing protein